MQECSGRSGRAYHCASALPFAQAALNSLLWPTAISCGSIPLCQFVVSVLRFPGTGDGSSARLARWHSQPRFIRRSSDQFTRRFWIRPGGDVCYQPLHGNVADQAMRARSGLRSGCTQRILINDAQAERAHRRPECFAMLSGGQVHGAPAQCYRRSLEMVFQLLTISCNAPVDRQAPPPERALEAAASPNLPYHSGRFVGRQRNS